MVIFVYCKEKTSKEKPQFQVPWSRLGQDPVLVYLDRIFLLAEPATEVEGSSEDAVQEARKSRVRVGQWLSRFM